MLEGDPVDLAYVPAPSIAYPSRLFKVFARRPSGGSRRLAKGGERTDHLPFCNQTKLYLKNRKKTLPFRLELKKPKAGPTYCHAMVEALSPIL